MRKIGERKTHKGSYGQSDPSYMMAARGIAKMIHTQILSNSDSRLGRITGLTDSHRMRLCRPITVILPSRDPSATQISHAGVNNGAHAAALSLYTTQPCPQSLGLGNKQRRAQISAFSSTRLREISLINLPKLQRKTRVNPKRMSYTMSVCHLRNPSPRQKPNALLPNVLLKYPQCKQRVR